MINFKPMLSGTVEDVNKLTFPLFASPKLDGIRAVVLDGVLLSRNLKPIPNQHLQSVFGHARYNGLDGELIAGEACSPTVFRDTSSAVMSVAGKPNVKFYVFDNFSEPELYFKDRVSSLERRKLPADLFVKWLPEKVGSVASLTTLEELWLEAGYEGAMLRRHDGPYKMGRSTLKEAYLLKLKRFADGEAEIVGFEEQQHNANEATTDALGRTKRTTHKAGKQGKGTLGALLVKDLKTGCEFNIGSGFTDVERAVIWANQPGHLGFIVRYKYFPTGSKDKPRFPVFVGFRDKIDL